MSSGDENGHTPRGWVVAVVGLALFAAATLAVFDRWSRTAPPVFDIRGESWPAHILYHHSPHPDSDLREHLPYRSPFFWWTDWFLDRFGRGYLTLLRGQAALLILLGAVFAVIGARAGPAAAFTSGALAMALPANLVMATLPDEFLFTALCVAVAAALAVHSDGGRRWWLMLPAGVAVGVAARFAFIVSTRLIFTLAALSAVGAWYWSTLARSGLLRFRGRKSGSAGRVGRFSPHIGLAAFALGFLLIADVTRYFTAYDWGYYAAETMNEDHYGAEYGRALNMLFYPYVVGRFLVGPVGVAFLAAGATGLVLSRSDDRWTHLAWFFALPLALGWMLKKGAYYILPAMPAAAAIAGIGLTRGPFRRAGPWLGAAAVAALASSSWLALFSPPVLVDVAAFKHLLGPDVCYQLRMPDQAAREALDPAPGLVDRMRRLRPGEPMRELHVVPVGAYESRIRFYLTARDENLLVLQPSIYKITQTRRPFLLFIRDRGVPPPADGAAALRLALDEESRGVSEGWVREKSAFQLFLEQRIVEDANPQKIYENDEVIVWDLDADPPADP